jgi:hypothetical protein
MSTVDIKAMRTEAEKELAEERAKEGKVILKDLLKQRDRAQEVVNNLNRQIELTEQQIATGTLPKKV